MSSPNSEHRHSPRYDKHVRLAFDYLYNATTQLSYEVEKESSKHAGVSKNIGATGLCLTSPNQLKIGQRLRLEVFLPNSSRSIHMDGLVRWCSCSGKNRELFDAGIKLEKVEGEPVDATVHLDEENHVLWSNVLESVFGTYRKIVQGDGDVTNDKI
jgi:hypothetical protein